jgi:hypothetical protein
MGYAEFVDMARKGDILEYVCGKCGMPSFRGTTCPFCGSRDLRGGKAPNEGEIVTYTRIFVAPAGLADDAPYIVALIELSDGLRVMGRMKADNAEIGEKVRFCGVKESPLGTALMFE